METYSDLLIQSGGSDVEEGSISDVAEERNCKQAATCDQCGGGLAVETGGLFITVAALLGRRSLMVASCR